MGILDEAIREHLELKRTHGAAEQDVQRLESEAFGPPTRPGDPDFPESDAEQAAEESPRSDDETASADGEPEASTALEEPATVEPLIEEPVAESQATEHPVVEEQPSDEVSLPASDRELETDEEEAVFFDREVEDELDLGDLELELDEDAALAEQELAADLEEDEAEDVEKAEGSTPPIDTRTEEHPVEHLEQATEGGPATHEEGEEDEDDDVLADTPDFLRDAPEDDELWFEQGEPKDFDFEDEKD